MSTELILSQQLTFHELIQAVIQRNGKCYIQVFYDTCQHEKRRSMELVYQDFNQLINKHIYQTDHNDVIKFIKHLGEKYSNNSTYNMKLQHFKKLFDLYSMDQLLKRNPIKELEMLNHASMKNRNTEKEYDLPFSYNDLLEVITEKEDRESVIIRFLFNTGLRISELINIKNSDIKDFTTTEKKIHVIGKGHKHADIKLSIEIYNQIKKIFTGDNEYLFFTTLGTKYHRNCLYKQITRRFDRYFNKKFGYKGKAKKKFYIRPHFLRHAFLSYHLENGWNLDDVRKAARHTNISTTQKYLHIKNKKEWQIV